ncbi:MAG: hypothetical protein JXB10_10295 [Pirellulales bacterium]|nr:hypothetical protein [Pirellulales bacterium]
MRFSPAAWAKLLFLRDLGETEVGGFGVTAAEDLLFVEDVVLVKQICTPLSVVFDDVAVADFFDQQVDRGLKPQQFARIWVHTHPGDCPQPSDTDEETFGRVFGATDWALMFILAQNGQSYARLRFNAGPGGEMPIPVAVDYRRPFPASDHDAWRAEYSANVQEEEFFDRIGPAALSDPGSEKKPFVPFGFDRDADVWLDDWFGPFEELPLMEEVALGSHI